MRDLVGPLPSEEQRQARAVRLAIEAAGGLAPCSEDTGKSEGQLSRCSSPHYPHSIALRDVVIIESAGNGATGHPHVTRLLCRLNGGLFVPLPQSGIDADGLAASMCRIAEEMGAVALAVRTAVADGAVTPRECRTVHEQLDELDAASAGMRLHLDALAAPADDTDGATPAGKLRPP
jgi:hypothetical protein